MATLYGAISSTKSELMRWKKKKKKIYKNNSDCPRPIQAVYTQTDRFNLSIVKKRTIQSVTSLQP